MAKGCDCGRFIKHEAWCASKAKTAAAPPGKRKRGPGLVPLESFADAKARAQKGRAMQNVGKPLKKQPHQWDIPPGHECVKRDGSYVIQEAAQKPWEDKADFQRRKNGPHGQNL